MLRGLLLGIEPNRRLTREAQAHIASRRFIGYGLCERLHDYSRANAVVFL